MRKTVLLALFCMGICAGAQAGEFNGVRVSGMEGPACVFFDYEAAVWHVAPMSEKGVYDAWKEIDPGRATLTLPDGGELVVRNNLPFIDRGGSLSPAE